MQLGQLREAIPVVVEGTARPVLSEHVNAGLVVVRHQRGVHRGIVVPRGQSADPHEGMSQLGGIAQRFLGDDVDGTRNGRCPEQGRASSAHHFHPFNHVGGNLFQSIYAGQRAEYRARVYQYLCVRPVQPVDTYLLKAAVLAVVLHTDARLEVQSLRQGGGVGLFEQFEVHYVDQRGSHAAGGFVSVGGHHYAVQRHEVFLQFEVLFQRDALFQYNAPRHGLIAHRADLHLELTFGQVFQKVVSRGVGQRGDSRSFQGDGDIG